jgi:Cof subfamily protein (haloacid dehalogenase superfamily)
LIKMIGLDLDDTLLGKDGKIGVRNKIAVEKASQKGVKVVIATGRSWRGTVEYAREINASEPAICYCGAKIVNPDGTVVEHQTIPLDLALRLVNLSRERSICLGVFVDDFTYVERITAEAQEIYSIYSFLKAIPDITAVLTSAPTQIMAMGDIAASTVAEYLKHSGLETSVTSLRFDSGTARSRLNLLAAGVDKANALSHLAQHYGISPEEIVAFGDSVADLGMLKYAGTGVAMGWAPEEVRQVADIVTSPDDVYGVASVIESIVL